MIQPTLPPSRRRLRGLWIARELPFPPDSGDRIYTACLLRAVAEAGVDLTVTGFAPESSGDLPDDGLVHWQQVAGSRCGALRALCSTMPHVAATHATPAYRRLVRRLARQRWDFVVIDQYGMGWALPAFVPRDRTAPGPLLVHVAHDHEASVCASLARNYRGSPARRLALWLNAFKTRVFERRIARKADLVTAITDEDAMRFAADAPTTPRIVLTPGYAGMTSARAAISAAVPRQVVMVGSYRWVAKQQNLRRFVAAADDAFARNGITLHVVGSIPEALAQELQVGTRATVIHGFVDDVAPQLASARIAIVPEEIGGGFKLKFLDYIFGRVAIATLSHAAAGLPDEIRRAMICRDDVESLVDAVVRSIDATATLDAMQAAAFSAAQVRFRWADRAATLLDTVTALIDSRTGNTGAAQAVAPTALGLRIQDAGVGGSR